MICAHDSRAVCWLCSDDRPWWREARVRAGLGILPPNGAAQRRRNYAANMIAATDSSVAEKRESYRRAMEGITT